MWTNRRREGSEACPRGQKCFREPFFTYEFKKGSEEFKKFVNVNELLYFFFVLKFAKKLLSLGGQGIFVKSKWFLGGRPKNHVDLQEEERAVKNCLKIHSHGLWMLPFVLIV